MESRELEENFSSNLERMSGIQLDDLLASYGDPYDPNIQTVISNKLEFAELASTPTEEQPKRGEYYKHQELIGRYMVWADRLLMIHQTGTGKTCSVVRVAEYFKRIKETGGHIKHVYILVKGKSLIREFQKQILCACTAGEYITDAIVNAKENQGRQTNITREIGKWYTILTYRTFFTKLGLATSNETPEQKAERKKEKTVGRRTRRDKLEYRSLVSDEDLIRKFSNCLFFVDEVQNLRTDPETGEKTQASQFVYDQYWRLFHLIQRSKVMLGSATPMINKVNEIGPIMNLILPAGEDSQFARGIDFDQVTLEQMEPYFRGRVSYVRSLDTGAIPKYVGEVIPGFLKSTDPETGETRNIAFQTIIKTTVMEEEIHPDTGRPFGQRIGYLEAARKTIELNKRSSFDHPKRQASVFVFPDNSYGNEGFRRYTKLIGTKTTVSKRHNRVVEEVSADEKSEDFAPTDELEAYLQEKNGTSSLRLLSCKYADIVDLCSRPNSGNCFVYIDYVEFGAILLGLAFQGINFTRFSETVSVFRSKEGESLGPPCPRRGEVTTREMRIKPALRYALLTFRSKNPEVVLETFNSYENRHGDYIKVLIGSPVAQVGINLANVLQVHIATAGWNPSSTYQAISRAIRATSHVDLISEIRDEQSKEMLAVLPDIEKRQRLETLMGEGLMTEKDAEVALLEEIGRGINPKIDIEIYKHAAVAYIGSSEDTSDFDSIDIQLYRESEGKEIRIQRVMRIMKQCAIDCQIHKERNIRPDDVDGTPVCDYAECDYQCVDEANGIPKPDQYDTETYDVYYSGPQIQEAIEIIKALFGRIFSITTPELYERLSDTRSRFIDAALTRLVTEKTSIIDRYGYACYLQVEGITVFLQRDYPLVPGKLTADSYVMSVNGNYERPLGEITRTIRLVEQEAIMNQIRETEDPTEAVFDRLVDQLDIDNKVAIVEEAIIEFLAAEGHPERPYASQLVTVKFLNFIHTFAKPVQRLDYSEQIMKTEQTGQGRKANDPIKARMKKVSEGIGRIPIDDDESLGMIYVHAIHGTKTGNVAYANMARFRKAEGRLRIYDPSARKPEWRDLQPYEQPVYTSLIQGNIEEDSHKYDEYNVSGIQDSAGIFRIRDRRKEDRTAIKEDLRLRKTGRKCDSYQKPELIEFLWALQIQPPRGTGYQAISRERMTSELLRIAKTKSRAYFNEMEPGRVEDYYLWEKSKTSRVNICEIMRKWMAANGRLRII